MHPSGPPSARGACRRHLRRCLAPVAEPTLQQPPAPREDHRLVKSALQFLAGKHQPQNNSRPPPPPTAAGRPRSPLLHHPLQCPPAAFSMGVLPPLGKLSLPLGGGACHWSGLFLSHPMMPDPIRTPGQVQPKKLGRWRKY